MKRSIFILMYTLLCASSFGQVNPKLQALFQQLKGFDYSPFMTIKSGGKKYHVYNIQGQTVMNKYRSHDSSVADSLIRQEHDPLELQVKAIRRCFDSLMEEAQESYHYEYHRDGRDTIYYSMNIGHDSTRVSPTHGRNRRYFLSDEYLDFHYETINQEDKFYNLNYKVPLPEPKTASYTLANLTDDMSLLFKQYDIKPRQAYWRHDKEYSDSTWRKNNDNLFTSSIHGRSNEGKTEATIYTVPLDQEPLALRLFAAFDSLIIQYTNYPQDYQYRYNCNMEINDKYHNCLLSSFKLGETEAEYNFFDVCQDEFGYHFVIAKTRGAEWIPRNWPSIKSLINGKKTYFKGMKPTTLNRIPTTTRVMKDKKR